MSLAGMHRYIPRPDWTPEDYARARRAMRADIERTRRRTSRLIALSIVCYGAVMVALLVAYFR